MRQVFWILRVTQWGALIAGGGGDGNVERRPQKEKQKELVNLRVTLA